MRFASGPVLISFALMLGLAGSHQPERAAPEAAQPATALRVQGQGVKSIELSLAELSGMPRRTLAVKDKDDKDSTYEGVLIQELLAKSGLAFGQSLRGPRLRDYLLAEAADGYAVVFALPEIATEFSDRVIIVADRVDGAPITGRDGPLRIIVSDEKKHARWVRNVVSLTIRTDAPANTPK